MPEPIIPVLFFMVAVLYASVGHAGASGYLAVMTLAIGLDERVARPTALVLNLIVATLGTVQFQRAGAIPWRGLAPYLIGSVPMALLGSRITVADATYKLLVGGVLLAASIRLLIGTITAREPHPPHAMIAVIVGAIIGILSGLTGTGGGIFLTPLVLLLGWARPREAAGMSVAFILVNSAVGLAGRLSRGGVTIPDDAIVWAIAAASGGLLGAWYGAHKSGLVALRRLLAIVLAIAAGKLLVSAF
jgi:uncharacterized protein